MLGDALVRPVFGTGARMSFAPPANYGSPIWGGNKVIWAVAPEVRTEALVRGRQLDGPSEVRFTYGDVDSKAEPLPELVIKSPSQTGSSGSAWRDVVTATRVQQPGCYAVQIDTRDRSEILVFQVV